MLNAWERRMQMQSHNVKTTGVKGPGPLPEGYQYQQQLFLNKRQLPKINIAKSDRKDGNL